jgi:phenylacetate-CoA ligase
MLDKVKNIYTLLPVNYLKFLKYIPDRFLFGRSFINYKSQIHYELKYFDQGLFETLKYSAIHTKYGKKYLPRAINKKDVKRIIQDLPIISSSDLSNNIDFYTSDEYNHRNSYSTTTGGTGRNPTTILLSNESFGIEWAHILNIWSSVGYNKKRDVKLTLRGNVIEGNKYYKFNPIYNEIVANTYLMNRNNFSVFIELIYKYKIKYIHGYPSLIREFYEYCKLHNVKIKLDGIFLGSEGIHTNEKQELGQHYNAKIISWYGQTEKVILADDINSNNYFKVFSSYGYPRILDADRNGFGEIIGTSFVNKALPLINYRTGDYGKLLRKDNALYLFDIEGRWGKDFIYVNEHKKIPTASVNLHSLIQKEILFYQIHQSKYGKITIKILPKANTKLSHQDLIDIFINDMKIKLNDFIVDYRIVKSDREIVKSSRGKMIMLIQDLT